MLLGRVDMILNLLGWRPDVMIGGGGGMPDGGVGQVGEEAGRGGWSRGQAEGGGVIKGMVEGEEARETC